jgi:hypothetical protein
MGGLTKTYITELLGNEVKPMAGRPAETVECFLETPVGVRFGNGAVWRRANDGRFVLWKFGMTECILAVALFQGCAVANGQCCHESDDRL